MAECDNSVSSSDSSQSSPQLTMADHRRVTMFLRELDNDQLIGVGVALGLYRPSLKRMNDLLGDMVSAWLREDDNVTVASGSPSWASLATALEDIGHKGIASKIRKGPMQVIQTSTPLSPEMSSTFSRYRNYLKSVYNTNPVARDDKLSIAPCSEFISLALVNKDESISKGDTFSQSTLYGGRDQISAHKVPLELEAILTLNSKLVLVEGAPGIGKSTLSWELCRKWDTLKSLKHYGIVLLLKLREGRIQNASSLNELFYHRDRALCKSVVSEVLRCEREGVLLILDGFDEMPASVVRNKESLIMEIISGTCIPRATRLVTSRLSAFHQKKCFPQEFKHVEIVGFTDESKEKFANIAFKSEPNVLSEFKKFIFSNPIIKSLMYIPVNCAILAQSYKDIMRSSKQVPKTTTQLYTMLTPVLIRRHLIAIGRWDEDSKVPSYLKDLPEDVKGDLERVSKLAYTGLFKEDIQLVFTDSDVGECFHPLGLLSEVKEMYVCEGARTSYSFLHLSMQEFLAAWHVSCHQELVEEALDKTLCSHSLHLDAFGNMLANLIGIGDLYLKYLIKCKDNELILFRALYTCHCFYETRKSFSSSLDFTDLVDLSTPLDVYVFGYCLAHVSHKWSRVTISSSIDILVSSLADHASGKEVLGSIETLILCCAEESTSSSSKLKDLPLSLLNSIKELVFEDDPSLALLEGMPVLHHLQKITIKVCSENDCFYMYIKKCPNLKLLEVYYGQYPLSFLPCDCIGGYYDCISLLNVCLHHHRPSMKKLQLPFFIPCTQFHLSSLSHALRRDPDTSQLKLRRSKSLSDLVCLKTLDEHARKHCSTTNPTFKDIMDSHTAAVKKTESCPVLVVIQSSEGSNKCRLESLIYS